MKRQLRKKTLTKSAAGWQSSLSILLLLVVLTGAGCGTVAREPILDRVASFDGNAMNSGFIRFDEHGGGVITPHARDRYNGLISKYGWRFNPVLKPDAGVTPGPGKDEFTITAEGLVNFQTLNRWKRQNE